MHLLVSFKEPLSTWGVVPRSSKYDGSLYVSGGVTHEQ